MGDGDAGTKTCSCGLGDTGTVVGQTQGTEDRGSRTYAQGSVGTGIGGQKVVVSPEDGASRSVSYLRLETAWRYPGGEEATRC